MDRPKLNMKALTIAFGITCFIGLFFTLWATFEIITREGVFCNYYYYCDYDVIITFYVIGVVLLLVAASLWMIHLHRRWAHLYPNASTTPGQAVGMMFIPIFHLGWVFQVTAGWVNEYNRLNPPPPGELPNSPGIAIATSIFLILMAFFGWIPFVGWGIGLVVLILLVLDMIMVNGLMAASASGTSAAQQAPTSADGGEGEVNLAGFGIAFAITTLIGMVLIHWAIFLGFFWWSEELMITFYIIGGIFALTSMILWLFQLHHRWAFLYPDAKISPGEAVGGMCIPIYHLFWIFKVTAGWITEHNRLYPTPASQLPASPGFGIAASIFLFLVVIWGWIPFLGWGLSLFVLVLCTWEIFYVNKQIQQASGRERVIISTDSSIALGMGITPPSFVEPIPQTPSVEEARSVVSQQSLFQQVPAAVEISSDAEGMGTEIAQRFQRQELIAEGGMARVFRAYRPDTNQIVVWKEAHNKFNPFHISNSKLQDEAELLQSFPHARMPDYIANGATSNEKGDRVQVLVMEFIEGGDLKNTIEQVKKMGMSLPLEKIIEILVAVCEPLEHLAGMAQPVYHRDLKPHNVIIHPEKGPIIIDFGLAKQVLTGEDVSITRGGSGTWTAPERDSGISGPFTDVYSLGKMLYHMLVKEQPPAILGEHNTKSILERGHPQWVANHVLFAAWPHHEQRIQTVREFRIRLQNQGNLPADASADGTGSDPTTGPGSASDDYTTWG